MVLSSWCSLALFKSSSLSKKLCQWFMVNNSIDMLATSAISIGYSLKAVNESGCAKKECIAWPPSCTMVVTSLIWPAAFIKINGAPDSAKGQLYPPGALPFLLSKSKCFKSFILRKQSAKNGFNFSKQATDLLYKSLPSVNGFNGAMPAGSASVSQGFKVVSSNFFFLRA